MGIPVNKPGKLCFCLALFFCFWGKAQSKKELKAEIANLKEEVKQAVSENARLQKQNALKEGQLLSLGRKVDSLNKELYLRNQVSDSLKEKRLSREDSLLRQRIKQAYGRLQQKLSPEGSSRVEKQEVFNRQSLTQCLRFEIYQSLFSEFLVLEYEIFPSESRFTGYFKHQYIPEFGDIEYSLQTVSGTYTEKGGLRELQMNRVENTPCNIRILHHQKAESSAVKAHGLQLQKIYTREVPVARLRSTDCY